MPRRLIPDHCTACGAAVPRAAAGHCPACRVDFAAALSEVRLTLPGRQMRRAVREADRIATARDPRRLP